MKNITTQATHHQATHALARIQRSHVLQFIESWNLLLEILHILWKLYIFWSAALCICQNTQSQHYYSEILSNPIWLMHWTFQRQWIFPVFFFSFQFYIGFNDPSFLSKESQQLYEIWWFATTLILIRLELGISMTFRLSRNSIALVAFNFAPIIIIMINGIGGILMTFKSRNSIGCIQLSKVWIPPLLVKFITYYLDVTLLWEALQWSVTKP